MLSSWSTKTTFEISTMSKSRTSMTIIWWEVLEPSVYPSWGKCSLSHNKHHATTLTIIGTFQWTDSSGSSWASSKLCRCVRTLLFKKYSQETVRLRLFPFSLNGEAWKWLAELPRESITFSEELVTTFKSIFLVNFSLLWRWYHSGITFKAWSVWMGSLYMKLG